VCWKPRSSCWSFHLLREEFLSAPIHSPPLWFAVSVLHLPTCGPHLIPSGHRVHRAEPTCLSTSWRPQDAKTFRARSSPAPTQIKPQPAPAILGQESVHTMLSITHHTKEQPSTGLQTLRSSVSLKYLTKT
jgi:hypothetical protein